jgi:CRISPR-associated endonuclease Cas1
MRSKASPPLTYTVNRGTVCVADGYRITVRVRHGRLTVEDGFGPHRRRREYTRVTTPIARLVVVGNGGSISLEALCWLRDLGAALIHVARDGRLVTTTTNETPDPRLRRAQALAATTATGLEISRSILTEKLRGQQRTLGTLTADPKLLDAMAAATSRLETATSVDELVWAERDAALAYWSSWSTVRVRFVPRDRDRVPDHWHGFGQRSSPLTSGPRLATNPANAILNYLYALLEAESRLALLAVGLDPCVGIVHADTRGRDSLALDLMEAARPALDDHVLTLLRSRDFRASHFSETRTGACTIRPPLTEELAETLATWRRVVAPTAEQLTRQLAEQAIRKGRPLPTPLTRANHAASREPVRKRVPPKAPLPPRTCKRCGEALSNRRRTYCDVCLPIFQREQLEARPPRTTSGRIAITTPDPTHGGEAARRRGTTNTLRKREARVWDEQYGKLLDLAAFDREILPEIQKVSLSVLSRATGLSIRYVSQIRRGEKRPHPRHWEALVRAVDRNSAEANESPGGNLGERRDNVISR